MDPKVSIIIPTYNRAEVLSRAIDSVCKQSFKDWELIIVDDGSTDSTSKDLQKRTHPQIKVIQQKNSGVSSARNKGICVAKGEWFAFLDSDDEWLPEKLKKQIEYLEDNPQIKMVHTNEIWVRNGVRVNSMNKHKKKGGDLYSQSLKLCCISPSTALLHRSLFNQFGVFREDFPVCEDYDLWLKITAAEKLGFLEEPLITKYGGHEDQLSTKFKAMDYWRILSMRDRILSGLLTDKQKIETQNEITYKMQLLLKGYRKHENLVNYDEVFHLLIELSNKNDLEEMKH